MYSLIKYLYVGAKAAQYAREDGVEETVGGMFAGCCFCLCSSFVSFFMSIWFLTFRGYDGLLAFLISLGVAFIAPLVMGILYFIMSLLSDFMKGILG